MIDDMYAVMRRINEIKTRFGLMRRQNTAREQPINLQGAGNEPLVRGIDANWPQGNEVERAINYLVGQAEDANQPNLQTQNPLVRGIGGLLGGGNTGEQNFFQTLLETIRNDDSSENE